MGGLLERNAPLVRATVDAFLVIQGKSWPNQAVHERLTSAAFRALEGLFAVHALVAAIEALCVAYPNVRVFWKDRDLRFLGVSARLAEEAGLESVDSIVGLFDSDPKLPWSRQAAKYQRDDRVVMASGKPLLEILERQDSGPDTTRWLKTSKAPIISEQGVVGLMGAFEVIDGTAAIAISKRMS